MDTNTQLRSFSDNDSYQHLLEVATKMAESEVIPELYRKKPASILIALDMANRAGVSIMTIMQNMTLIKGKTGFMGKYVIARINSCGIYDRLKYRMAGKGDTLSCVAYATEKSTGLIDEGPAVTMEMAKAEGWLSNPKWKTMPELMIRYRAAAFFGSVYTPDVTMGMSMTEEIEDIPSSRYHVVEEVAPSKEELERALILISDCVTVDELVAIKNKIDVSAWEPEDAQTFNDAGKAKQMLLTTKKSDDEG